MNDICNNIRERCKNCSAVNLLVWYQLFREAPYEYRIRIPILKQNLKPLGVRVTKTSISCKEHNELNSFRKNEKLCTVVLL